MHKSSTLFFLSILFLLVIGPADSGAAVIHETGDLSINGWRFHYSKHSFRADDSPEAFLEVRKNPSGRSPRTGFIVLNHRRFPLKRFLHSQEDTLTRRIKLHRHNRLRVFLFGSPGASISTVIHDSSAAPLPTVDFSATPETIMSGSAINLAWATTHADTCHIEPNIGSVATNGSLTISPDTTTTYTLTATGPGGSTSATAAVTVNRPVPTVDLTVRPGEIISGASAVLQWSSTNADSCRIDPDVGAVELQGELSVFPTETTTYTISATGSGGSASASVLVAVTHPEPTVTLSVDPQEIVQGGTATLTWTSEFAETCAIDPDFGQVEPSGSMPVSPEETTTYQIAAAGAGVTTTAEATITVTPPLPTVEITATPTTITPGEKAILSWTSSHAQSCVIQPDIGIVDPSGSISVSPAEDTTYTISASGAGGTMSSAVTIAIRSPISLQILSPVDASVVNRPDVLVLGTFDNSTGSETGITVNGEVATVYGNQFVFNHLPLKDGENTITVTATDINGQSETTTSTVTADIPEHYIRLVSNIESGSSPLEATLQINGTFSIEDATLSYIGETPEELMEIEPDEYQLRMTEKGITYLTAEVIHETVVYTDTIAVVAVNTDEIDALLQQKWSGMKTALISGDIELALEAHHEHFHDKYRAIYHALGDNLPTLAGQMQNISMINCIEGGAKYRIRQDHDVDGQIVSITYYVYFIRDEDGLWKIEKY